MSARALLALALGACTGAEGTVEIELTTAPGSKLLDGVEHMRMIVTSPHQEVDADRVDGGFALTLDLSAAGGLGAVIVEGRDANNALVAFGESPPFAISGITARIIVYMPPPMSIESAPLQLTPARSDLSTGTLSFGCLFAGGRLANGEPSDATAIYNAFDHTITEGLPLPAPRAGVALAVDATGHAILFGGAGPDGQPTDTLWGFDTTFAPTGAYTDLGEQAGFARADQIALFTATGELVISGTPAAGFSNTTTALVARSDIATLPPVGVGLTTSDGILTAVFAGVGTTNGYARFRSDMVDLPAGDAARTGGAITTIPNGQVLFVGGSDAEQQNTDALVLDAMTAVSSPVPSVLSTPRNHPGIAATSRYLLVAGGTDDGGAALDTVDVIDVTDDAVVPVTTLQMSVPRISPTLIALPNDAILIAGGTDQNGQPIATLELFTPDPPPDGN